MIPAGTLFRLARGTALAGLAAAILMSSPHPAAAQERINHCLDCHSRLGGRLGAPAKEYPGSAHRVVGVTCVTCHGGDPSQPGGEGMDPHKGFRGKPKVQEIPRFCGTCHSDAARMRQYNLPTDQLAEYRRSYHGRLLFEKNDTRVAVCTSCHGKHDIRRKSDPQSLVFRSAVPATCGKCHADPGYMKPYGIPVQQLQDFENGIHGRILAGKIPGKNPSIAPNCATCHGVHGATPPGVAEIANICGNCHGVVAAYFREGPHSRAVAETGEPKCITCHGNHSNRNPSLKILAGTGPGECGACHEKGSAALEFAGNVRELMLALDSSMEGLRREYEEASRSGRNVDRLKAALDSARNKTIEIEPVFHTFSIERVLPLIHQADGFLRNARKEADLVREEYRQRRSVSLYAVTMLLVIAGLLGIRLALLPKTPPPGGGKSG